MENLDSWHFDKRVPVALIATIVAQTIGVGFWVGNLSNRVSELETKAINALDKGERLIKVESDVVHIRGSLDRIEEKLDQQYPD